MFKCKMNLHDWTNWVVVETINGKVFKRSCVSCGKQQERIYK